MASDYGIAYDDHVVQDPSWLTEADVMKAYHYSGWIAPDGRVTGVLVRRVDGQWVPVH